MKKIIINEESVKRLGDISGYNLPDFILNGIKTNNTSLGDCKAFPPNDGFGFAYSIIKERFMDVTDRIRQYGYDTSDENLIERLGELIKKCSEIERNNKERVEKVCWNIVNDKLNVPSDTVVLKCNLVNKIRPESHIRLLPEDSYGNTSYSFEDVEEIELHNREVEKRRVINALIQGLSNTLTRDELNNDGSDIDSISIELRPMYCEIMDINDYLIFSKKEVMSEKNPSQNSYVETRLGHGDEKTKITSQGIILPFLLSETFRGFFELFSSKGLPKDNTKAMQIVRKADFVMAEPWDMRFGVKMWEKINDNCGWIDSGLIPYFFSDLCSLGIDEFNDVMKNMLAGTEKGKRYVEVEINKVTNNSEYQTFKDRIQRKNSDVSIISDGFMSSDDIDKVVF